MRQLFDLFLTGNYSVKQLQLKSHEMGLKNNFGNPLSESQLYITLKNPFYTGTRFFYGGKLYTNAVHKRMISDAEYDLVQDIILKKSRPRFHKHKGFLNGVLKCGECGSMITAERHVKKYLNGNSQVFTYYRCTKKKTDPKCKQPYISVDKLDAQAMDVLSTVTLSTKFVEWGIKWLKVMHSNQSELKEASLQATQNEYNAVEKKLDNLINLLIDEVITPEQGKAKRAELEEKKNRLFTTLSNIDTNSTEWTNLTIETFNFVKTAQDKFHNGTIEQKKTILRVIGSNLTVKDKILGIELREPFKYIQDAHAEFKKSKGEIEAKLPKITAKEAFTWSMAGSTDSKLCG